MLEKGISVKGVFSIPLSRGSGQSNLRDPTEPLSVETQGESDRLLDLDSKELRYCKDIFSEKTSKSLVVL